jgi:hypothetical protein
MSPRVAYFFEGSRYLRYNILSDAVDVGPAEIATFWPALPPEFQRDLDATVNWGDGHAYFFKGSRYLRYNILSDAVDVGPTEIATFWPALPPEFQRDIQAIVNWSHTIHWENVSRDDRILYVIERLIDQYGYPLNGAAGLVGNLVTESSVIPSRIEGSAEATPMRSKNFAGQMVAHTPADVMNRNATSGVGPALPGIGLAQWTTGSRRSRLFTHPFNGTAQEALVLFNMDAQIDYLVHELATSFGQVNALLTAAGGAVNGACDEVLYNFEVPASILQGGKKLPRNHPAVQAALSAGST